MRKSLLVLAVTAVLLVLASGLAFAAAGPHNIDYNGLTCANCHSTHQAATATYLLNSAAVAGGTGVTSICMTCHNGSSATNVVTGNWSVGSFSTVGLMNTTGSGASAHNVDLLAGYTATIGSAPGNPNNETDTLTCASCHQPHGTFNPKLLVVNPNGKNAGQETFTLTRDANGVYNAPAGSAPWLRTDAPYRASQELIDETNVLVSWDNGVTWHKYMVTDGSHAHKEYSVNFNDGQVKFDQTLADPGTATIEAKAYMPFSVKTASTFTGLNNTTMAIYGDQSAPGNTYGMTEWCAACHEQYSISNRANSPYVDKDGVTRYAHNVKSRSADESYGVPLEWGVYGGNKAKVLSCVSCHYAHGTEPRLQVDANQTMVSTTGAIDSAPDNQRYIGYGICVRCHMDSHGETFLWNSDMRPDWGWPDTEWPR